LPSSNQLKACALTLVCINSPDSMRHAIY
jgi:hypothetical protein